MSDSVNYELIEQVKVIAEKYAKDKNADNKTGLVNFLVNFSPVQKDILWRIISRYVSRQEFERESNE